MISVGFIGVGQMGRPMVDRLAASNDVAVTVFVRRAELADELRAAGVPVAASAAELAAGSDLLIVCMFSDAQVREALLQDPTVLAALRPGSVLVSHVTGSPGLAAELQAAVPAGVTVLDVPISGTSDSIRAGTLTLLVGGDAEALERVRPAFAAYSDPILHVGGLGDGQRIKLVNNLLFAVNLRVALAAARLGEALGVPPSELSPVLAECSGDSFAMRLFAKVPSDALVAGAKPYLHKDVAVIREVAASLSIDLGELGELAGWVDD